MHNLTGVFVQPEPDEVYDGVPMHCFSVIYPHKTRIYLSDDQKAINNWIRKIQEAIGYHALSDIYEVKVNIS